MKKIIYALVLVFIAFSLKAQQNGIPGVTNLGSDGVFVYNFFKPANPNKANKNGAVSFKIERADNNEVFKTIAEYSSPSNISEFIANIEIAKKKVPFPVSNKLYDVQVIWIAYSKCNCFDSIARMMSYMEVQMAFGFIYKDETVKKGNKYQYRVSEIGADKKVINAVTSLVDAFPAVSGFQKPMAYNKEERRDLITVKWYTLNRGKKPDLFKIWRKRENETKFTLLKVSDFFTQKNDTLFYDANDDNVDNESYYSYIIQPSNFWGIDDVNSDTMDAFTMPLGDILLPQMFKAIPEPENNAIRLSWRVHRPAFVGTIQIWRSISYDGTYEQIGTASSSDTGFVDYGIHGASKHYYYLTITDRLLRNSLNSVRVFGLYESIEKPLPITQVLLSRKNNKTDITWECTDKNIAGFYINRCVGIEGDLTTISHFIPTKEQQQFYTFTDTGSLGSNSQYGYCIVKESKSYVKSDCSPISYIQNTQKSYLKAPTGLSVNEAEKGLLLFWEDMRELNPTLAGYNLYFVSAENKLYKVNSELIPSQRTTYNDELAKVGQLYHYQLECVDISGNKSNLSELVSYQLNPEFLTTPSGLFALAEDGKVSLTFNKALDSLTSKFQLYRYTRENEPEMIAEFSAQKDSYEDENMPKKLYFYYLIAIDKNGNSSKKSKEVSVMSE